MMLGDLRLGLDVEEFRGGLGGGGGVSFYGWAVLSGMRCDLD